MWRFSERFITALQTQVDARIESLEKRVTECETDRIRLNAQIIAILERNARVDIARENPHS